MILVEINEYFLESVMQRFHCIYVFYFLFFVQVTIQCSTTRLANPEEQWDLHTSFRYLVALFRICPIENNFLSHRKQLRCGLAPFNQNKTSHESQLCSQFLRAPKCRTTQSATATGRSRSSDDSLKSSEFNFFNEEVNLLSAMKHRLSKLIYLDRFCISRICSYNDGGWLIRHGNQLRTT